MKLLRLLLLALALVSSPAFAQNKINLNTQVKGTLPVANGGTSQTTAPAALATLQGFTTTATAAGTTTLTSASTFNQVFTGTTTQTVVLPVTSTLAQGWTYRIINASTGALTVQSSGANTIATVPAGTTWDFVTVLTSGTTAASWNAAIIGNTGTLPVGNGGTGQTSYTDGQLLIGNTTGNTLTPATLTAGANVTITNGHGSITIASSGGGGASFRGTLVKKSADLTGTNLTLGGFQAWDAEDYDTDAIHDNVTNNSRLTVPSGVTKVRLIAQLSLSLGTANTWTGVYIYKNGSWPYVGSPAYTAVNFGAADFAIQATSPVLTVTSGDYFQLAANTQSDTSMTINAVGSWFAMEIIQ